MTQAGDKPRLRGSDWIVAQFSTKRKELPLDQLTLIGVAGQVDDMSGLIRLPTGEVLVVKQGQQTAAGVVMNVDVDGILLQRTEGFVSLYPPAIS